MSSNPYSLRGILRCTLYIIHIPFLRGRERKKRPRIVQCTEAGLPTILLQSYLSILITKVWDVTKKRTITILVSNPILGAWTGLNIGGGNLFWNKILFGDSEYHPEKWTKLYGSNKTLYKNLTINKSDPNARKEEHNFQAQLGKGSGQRLKKTKV